MSSGQGRPVGPNELRCVARQSLDLYRTLIVGGIYSTDHEQKGNLEPLLRKAVKHCVARHPILSAIIEDEDTQHPRFAKPAALNVKNHLELRLGKYHIIRNSSNLETTLERMHDAILPDREKVPPWRVQVHPIDEAFGATKPSSRARFLILFGYYHSHGDGMAGPTFAKTLVEGLNLAEQGKLPDDDKDTFGPCEAPFLPPLEEAAKLSVSWSFLLSPLLGEYLPTFVANAFGFRPSPIPPENNHWTGKLVGNRQYIQTAVKMLSVPDTQVQKLLSACRQRNCRLTGLLHQLVVRALTELLPADTPAGCFVSQSAVDMRRVVDDLGDEDMALSVTGYYETFPRATCELWADWTTGDSTHPLWAAVKRTTDGLAETANRLSDQPIALLRYLTDMRRWTLDRVGKPRECSYELSNLRAFDPQCKPNDPWQIESMVFSQPANLSGGCFDTNVVTRTGGDMTIVLSWQVGALGLENEKYANEKHVMARACRLLRGFIDEL